MTALLPPPPTPMTCLEGGKVEKEQLGLRETERAKRRERARERESESESKSESERNRRCSWCRTFFRKKKRATVAAERETEGKTHRPLLSRLFSILASSLSRDGFITSICAADFEETERRGSEAHRKQRRRNAKNKTNTMMPNEKKRSRASLALILLSRLARSLHHLSP